MRTVFYRSVGDPIKVENPNVVVIEGGRGQPLVVAADLGNGTIFVELATPGNEEALQRLCDQLGLRYVVRPSENLGSKLVPFSQLPKL